MAIFRSDPSDNAGAAASISRLLDDAEAVEWCSSLLADGYGCWAPAFLSLCGRPKDAVIDYVLQMVRHPDPYVRNACYVFCYAMDWDDLLVYAESDLHDTTPLLIVNGDAGGESLAKTTSKYINAFSEQSKVKRKE